MSLAVKYRPKTFKDVVEQNTVTEILENICNTKSLDNRNFLLIGSAGCGKAQPLYTKILTPDGFIAMRDVKPGTTVFTRIGNPAKVLGVYPQGKRPIYEIGLQDRTTIRVSDDHLNVVFLYNSTTKQKEYKILTTSQLIELFNTTKRKIRIDIPSIEFNDDSSKLDTAFHIGQRYTCKKKFSSKSDDNLVKPYTHLDLDYIFSSKSVRLELFKGMMMSSIITSEGYVKFSTADDIISKTVAFVGRSLGIRVTEGLSLTSTRPLHVLYFHPPKGMNIVEHHKYAHRFRQHRFEPTRNIEYIKYIGEEECQCIYVDDPDHTYICEDGFIPTHNTTSARIMANMLNDGKGEPIEIDAASHNGVDSVRELIQQAKTYPVGTNYKVFIIDECFHKNTLVNTPDGLKRISDISVGDFVCSANMFARVKSVKINKVITHNLIKLYVDNKCIVTTTHHLFFTKRGWVEAGLLKPQDEIFTRSGIHHACKYGDIAYPIDVDGYIKVSEYDNSFIKQFQMPKFTNTTFEDGIRSKCVPSKLFAAVTKIVTYDDSPIEFLNYFDSSELGTEIVDMYDLEIDGYPSYYVDGMMVHNCHSFSNQAWQVLLKTLEEGPAKSIFIFATTNPEKIPDTILSRVQTFQLSKISLKGIHDRLSYVLDKEISEGRHIQYTDDAISYIAKLAQGGMRDALTTLDKALAYSEDITVENLSKALNLPKYDDYFDLLSAYAKKDNSQIASIIDSVYNSGINFVKWMESFHSFVINIVKYIFMQDIGSTLIPSYYKNKISAYGLKHSAICLRLANKLVQLNHELKTTQYQQELVLTYLCFIPKSQN